MTLSLAVLYELPLAALTAYSPRFPRPVWGVWPSRKRFAGPESNRARWTRCIWGMSWVPMGVRTALPRILAIRLSSSLSPLRLP